MLFRTNKTNFCVIVLRVDNITNIFTDHNKEWQNNTKKSSSSVKKVEDRLDRIENLIRASNQPIKNSASHEDIRLNKGQQYQRSVSEFPQFSYDSSRSITPSSPISLPPASYKGPLYPRRNSEKSTTVRKAAHMFRNASLDSEKVLADDVPVKKKRILSKEKTVVGDILDTEKAEV